MFAAGLAGPLLAVAVASNLALLIVAMRRRTGGIALAVTIGSVAMTGAAALLFFNTTTINDYLIGLM